MSDTTKMLTHDDERTPSTSIRPRTAYVKSGRNWSRICIGVLGMVASLLIVAILSLAFAKALLPYPSHASCQVNVTFFGDEFFKNTPICDAVKDALVKQMNEWESIENCQNGGMKCLYKVTSVSADELRGTHTTSDWFRFVDEIRFRFRDSARGDCLVEASSRSTFPLAWLDFSVNYCNIHNLITGYGFEKFEEVTSDEVCTLYSTADCEKY